VDKVFSIVLCSVRDGDDLAKQSANSSGRMSQIHSLDGAKTGTAELFAKHRLCRLSVDCSRR